MVLAASNLPTATDTTSSDIANSGSNCRCLFGDSCWPSASEFSKLAKQVSQPLLNPLPPASPCYPLSRPSGDCDAAQRLWTDPAWRANQSGAMQSANFETFVFRNGTTSACFIDTTLGIPCGQGSVPVAGVDAHSDADIQAAIKFAAAHNLRVVVKGNGHDLSGRSTARGSFVIWTHHMKNIAFHAQFTPTGAPKSEAVAQAITLGAGIQWQEAYNAVNIRNRVLVGGLSPGGTVGAAGGWVLGGGHSVLSPTFGLGVDNVLEFTMISSNGTRLTANAHRNTDLFFALRGGGGGTYGVVTSVTYQTHTNLPLISAVFSATPSGSQTSRVLQTLLTDFMKALPGLSDAGWGGTAFLGADATGNVALSGSFVLFNGTMVSANQSTSPFFSAVNRLASTAGNLTFTTSLTPFDSFQTWYTAMSAQGANVAGSNGALGSWLLPRDVIEKQPEHVAETLLPLTGLVMGLYAGGAVARVDPNAMGLNPAWRTTLLHTIFATGWVEGTPVDVIDSLVDQVRQNMTNLRALAPDSGAYFNEASLVEPDPLKAFFGDHRTTLKAIKRIYDPIDMFVVPEGIGSDDFDDALVCKV
ncbi:FAD-binding domain-containing protein [Lentinus tigrinus ALCF2SS1-6]|uniref:FAD-binding domain-containing protein n=1 Tax=Lentinus tigrinus ALCF2SS1-6 TaxID=1328759 RepID=A0A5C2SN55_9APHY|nr:FAD-binding domain-containing protein [Lentinus tigrinus ALCF2SS1-6]